MQEFGPPEMASLLSGASVLVVLLMLIFFWSNFSEKMQIKKWERQDVESLKAEFAELYKYCTVCKISIPDAHFICEEDFKKLEALKRVIMKKDPNAKLEDRDVYADRMKKYISKR